MTTEIFETNKIAFLTWEETRSGSTYSDEIEHQWNRYNPLQVSVQFQVERYLSDEEDYFGVRVHRYQLIANMTNKDLNFPGIIDYRSIGLGDFCRVEDAQYFAQYALKAWQDKGDWRACPVIDLIDD
jgi:hypothetical protein